jgi:hypothetical protein
MIAQLNAWGAARDRDMLSLRADLSATQVGVSEAFTHAQEAVLAIVSDFRLEAATMRQQGQNEAAQAIARLEAVVGDARARFAAQDATRVDDLGELNRRLLAIDAWAQAEPQRVAAHFRTAAATVPTSPGGTPLVLTALGARAMGLCVQQPQPQLPQVTPPPGMGMLTPQPAQPQWAPPVSPASLYAPTPQPQQQQQ